MKKPRKTSEATPLSDDLRDEYSLDFREARANRFAGKIDRDCLMVSLDADVAEVFKTSQAVNVMLRAMIHVMREVSSPSLMNEQK